ncbi:MAG TPA: hypothetical protein VJO16_20320 [Candidatus Acidoferrum sp.]|nr:hypothetical protein [Candidatus Acidoferrum sp.]
MSAEVRKVEILHHAQGDTNGGGSNLGKGRIINALKNLPHWFSMQTSRETDMMAGVNLSPGMVTK